jgi:hypothetical protein
MEWVVLLGTIGFLSLVWYKAGRHKGSKQTSLDADGVPAPLRRSEQFESRSGGRSTRSPPKVEFVPAALPLSTDGRDYDIEYGDADGVISTRRIKVLEVEGSVGAVYLRATCLLRNAERTFRADRILSAKSAMTGERLQDPVGYFRSQFIEMHEKDADHDAVMARVRGGLNLLIWIAMADREISSDEQEILLEYIAARNALAGTKYASVPWRRVRATRYIDQARPTFADAAGFLAGISKTGREWRMLDEFSSKVASAGGAVSENRRRQLFK